MAQKLDYPTVSLAECCIYCLRYRSAWRRLQLHANLKLQIGELVSVNDCFPLHWAIVAISIPDPHTRSVFQPGTNRTLTFSHKDVRESHKLITQLLGRCLIITSQLQSSLQWPVVPQRQHRTGSTSQRRSKQLLKAKKAPLSLFQQVQVHSMRCLWGHNQCSDMNCCK